MKSGWTQVETAYQSASPGKRRKSSTRSKKSKSRRAKKGSRHSATADAVGEPRLRSNSSTQLAPINPGAKHTHGHTGRTSFHQALSGISAPPSLNTFVKDEKVQKIEKKSLGLTKVRHRRTQSWDPHKAWKHNREAMESIAGHARFPGHSRNPFDPKLVREAACCCTSACYQRTASDLFRGAMA